MKQVFHHYTVLEEHKAGMWRQVPVHQREDYVRRAAVLMRDPARFLAGMLRAVAEWPLSCEAALTTPALNARAFMGHAGCCVVTGSPEDLTRLAWHTLTPSQQDAANAAADKAIDEWERRYRTMPTLWSVE